MADTFSLFNARIATTERESSHDLEPGTIKLSRSVEGLKGRAASGLSILFIIEYNLDLKQKLRIYQRKLLFSNLKPKKICFFLN